MENNNFCHVSMDLSTEEKEFIPSIPIHRCKGEDATIERVCGTPSLEGSIGAFPSKKIFINNMHKKNESYLAVYETPLSNHNYLTDKAVKVFVPDAHITKEHWILNSFKCKPYLIRINKLKLSCYDKYNDEWSGFVEEFNYDKSIEDYDREMIYSFIDKRFLKKALDFAKKNDIKYEILEESKCHLYHRRYCSYMFTLEKYYGTSKTYHLTKIKFYIHKNKDVSNLWLINEEQNKFSMKKNISFEVFNPSVYDELRKYEGDYQGYFEDMYEKENN